LPSPQPSPVNGRAAKEITVIPAKAGTHLDFRFCATTNAEATWVSSFRWNDGSRADRGSELINARVANGGRIPGQRDERRIPITPATPAGEHARNDALTKHKHPDLRALPAFSERTAPHPFGKVSNETDGTISLLLHCTMTKSAQFA